MLRATLVMAACLATATVAAAVPASGPAPPIQADVVCSPVLLACPAPCPEPPFDIILKIEVCLEVACTTSLPPSCHLDCDVAVNNHHYLTCR